GWPDDPLHRRVERQALATPEAIAARQGTRTLSYRQLDRRANHLAHQLRRLGVARDDRVALLCHRSFEHVIGALAVLKAGAAFVPIDTATPRERIMYILRDSAARVLVHAAAGGAEAAGAAALAA